ncbi:MAG TPA: MaoC family dehydratase N-terminal domain-containing protein [Actinomycetota bacterium]|nr:MaoC family dehydratase N-terminal domain-containing protein [Actinomycetota bacterium]
MALRPDVEGSTYPPVRFLVDEVRVRAFADAVGQGGPGVPPTIVTVPEIEAGLDHVVSDPRLGIDLSRVLHGEQEYRWSRPVVVGETLTASATIESVRNKGGIRFLTLRTEVLDEAGELVVAGRSTLIVRSDG